MAVSGGSRPAASLSDGLAVIQLDYCVMLWCWGSASEALPDAVVTVAGITTITAVFGTPTCQSN